MAALATALFVAGAGPASAEPEARAIDYQVVVNQEDQYVIFPVDWDLPGEWKPTGKTGTLEDSHNYIEEVWTDMRPLSVRREHSREADYRVIVNREGQHAVWPAEAGVPRGWKGLDQKGPLDECQAYIEQVWTDMRPLSVREALAARR